jgi:oligopeptide transport system substrate-binding protein
VLRISQRNEPATLDPQLATLPDEFFIIRALGEGLLTPDPDGGAPLPGAAETWTVSPDGLTYTFHLRPGAKWSNGDPVSARDFAWSIQRALTPGTAAPKAALFLGLKNAATFHAGRETDFARVGVRTPDALTLLLELARPDTDFAAMVASGPWIPVHRATVESLRAGHPPGYVGNGPFTLTEWAPNQRLSVRKNPRYWDATAVQLDAIQFLAMDNGDTEERAFRAGQLDVTMAVPFTKLATYRTEQPGLIHRVPLHETRYLALNTTRPPLHDARVRRALALALDRTALVEKVLLSGQPAPNFVPAGLGGYAPSARITEDATEARRLLAEAGFPDGRGFPRLELATWPVNPAPLEAVQQMWRRELGIEIALAPREARTHLASLAGGDYAIAFMTAIPDYDGASDQFTQLTGGHPLNHPHWRDAEFDRLVASAGALTDPAARNAAYQQAEARLLTEMPVIPLYYNAQNFLVSPRVHGWRADRLWTRFYRRLSVD